MINNGTAHYDHDRDGTHTMIGGCEVKFRNFAHDTYINIRYENDVLTVTHDLDNKRAWEPCLKVEGVKLPTGYLLGASAATGKEEIMFFIIFVVVYLFKIQQLLISSDNYSNLGKIKSESKK